MMIFGHHHHQQQQQRHNRSSSNCRSIRKNCNNALLGGRCCGRSCCRHGGGNIACFRPLALDVMLLFVVFVTATIATVIGEETRDKFDNGGDNGGVNTGTIAHELKLYNQKNSRNDDSGGRTSEGSSSDRHMWENFYGEPLASAAAAAAARNTNASVYSIRNHHVRKTTNKTRSSSSSGSGSRNNNTDSIFTTSKRRKQTPYEHHQTTTTTTTTVSARSDKNAIDETTTTWYPSNISINRPAEQLDRYIHGDYRNNNKSQAKGEWSGIDYIGYNGNTSSSSSQDRGENDGNEESSGTPVTSGSQNRTWALVLIGFPILTIFGNSLVVLSVIKEKNLRTVTNYFVVSLAIADLTVAAAVMPFAVYYEVKQKWEMSKTLCDAWVATDVMASTASILNLVAIAIDRFIAVTRPIKYARHSNMIRTYITIALVWTISMAVASPIVGGLNDTSDRELDQCAFNNEKFLIYSSMASFYIPTIVMIFLYYRVFKVIRMRAKKSNQVSKSKVIARKGAKRNSPTPAITADGRSEQQKKNSFNNTTKTPPTNRQISEPVSAQGRRRSTTPPPSTEKLNLISAGIFALKNKSVSSAALEPPAHLEPLASTFQLQSSTNICVNNNTNTDNLLMVASDIRAASAADFDLIEVNQTGETGFYTSSPSPPQGSSPQQKLSIKHRSQQQAQTTPIDAKATVVATTDTNSLSRNKSLLTKAGLSLGSSAAVKVKKKSRAQKAMNVFKSQSSASASNKEKKVTKTLAIVLIVFLVCWTPFFTVNNIMKGLCKEVKAKCAFIKDEYISFLTWLGYVNSLLNPIIYTIFNIEFRRAFAKILSEFCCRKRSNRS